MRSLLSCLALLSACASPPRAAVPPFKPGDPVDIARFGVVKTWKGPHQQYPRRVRLQEGFALAPSPGGGWEAAADEHGPANIGVEWEEQRVFDRVVLKFPEGAAPDPEEAELQIWAQPGDPKALAGADSPHAGQWRTAPARPEVAGATWTWPVPPVKNGTYKVRLALRGASPIVLSDLACYGASTWRQVDLIVQSPLREEVYNGILLGWRHMSGHIHEASVLAAATTYRDSPDRTVVTLRGDGRGFSFLVDDVLREGTLCVPGLATWVTARSPAAGPPANPTIRQRVATMPEQTLDHALRNTPPKERNKFLALAPACNVNKFAVHPNGNAFPRKDKALQIEFATGAKPDFTAREAQRVEDDFLPILIAEWEEGPIRWRQEYGCVPLDLEKPEAEWRGDETTVLVTRITATNTAKDARTAEAWVRLRRDKTFVDVPREGFLYIDDARVGHLDAGGAAVQNFGTALVAPLALEPGASLGLTLKILSPGSDAAAPESRGRLAALTFDAARDWTRAYWTARLAAGARFQVPEERLNRLWKSLLIHQSMWGDLDAKTGRFLPNVAAFIYGPVGNESSQMVKALDMFGDPVQARRYLEPMITMQGTDTLNARVESGEGALVGYWAHYTFNTGFILWNAANHYRFTRDREWLAHMAPRFVKACDWIAKERRATMKTGPDGRKALGYGFFPPCGLEDLPVWQYWTMTNAYLAGGMRHAAEVLADIGHPDAARIAEEARAFQADVAAGVREATIRCPVVPLQDGTWVPYIPKHLHQRGRPTGEGDKGDYEAELGALHLAGMDLFPPASPEIDATLDFHEDEVYLTEAPNDGSILSFSRLRENWFNLGGYGKTQPYLAHTAVTYIRRDEPKHALRSFCNNLVAQNWHDINAFPEHISRHGAADCKTYEEAMALQQFRSLLVHEEGGELWIAPAASRHWFADGQSIAVERAPTFFGPLTYTIRSEAANGRIVATIEPPRRNPPSAIRLRLRHPREKPMCRVTVNGRAHADFDAAREWIFLRVRADRLEVVAEYAE